MACCVTRCRSINAGKVIVSPPPTASSRRFSTSTHCFLISDIASLRGGTKVKRPWLKAADACVNLCAFTTRFHMVKLFHLRYFSKKGILRFVGGKGVGQAEQHRRRVEEVTSSGRMLEKEGTLPSMKLAHRSIFVPPRISTPVAERDCSVNTLRISSISRESKSSNVSFAPR